MSRAYRIRVRETMQQVLKAEDHVSTQLELLDILPREAMGELLAEELRLRGFADQEGKLVRQREGIRVTIDPGTGDFCVESEACQKVTLEGTRESVADTDWGQRGAEHVQADLKEKIRSELVSRAEQEQSKLQNQVTQRLEGELIDLQRELGQAINRVTGEALKRRAAEIGQIKEISEDPSSGSLTIVLEV